MNAPLIVKVIRRYYQDWEPPKDTGKEWYKVVCPFHGDGVASASVSYLYNAFRCHGCGISGSAVRILKEQEEVSFAEAKRLAEELSEGSDPPVPPEPPWQSRRRVFGDKGSDVPQHPRGGRPVHARVRGRPTPWA